MKTSANSYFVYVAHSQSIPNAFRVGVSKDTQTRVRSLSDGLPQPYRIMFQQEFNSKTAAQAVEHSVTLQLKAAGQHINSYFYTGPLESIVHAIVDNTSVATAQPELELVSEPTVTKIRGVDFHKGSGKWRARKRVQGLDFYLGHYDSKQDAQSAVIEFLNRLA